nr:unnamed protein product [Spirometra erinaceieuropaei]
MSTVMMLDVYRDRGPRMKIGYVIDGQFLGTRLMLAPTAVYSLLFADDGSDEADMHPYSGKAAKTEVFGLPGMAGVDGLGLHSVQECRQDDGFVPLQLEAVMISHWSLKSAEDLADFEDPVGHFVVDLDAA